MTSSAEDPASEEEARKERLRERRREYVQRPEVRKRINEYQRKWRDNPERVEQRREYRQRPENIERRRAYVREYYADPDRHARKNQIERDRLARIREGKAKKERQAERHKKWRDANPERVKEYRRRYHEANPNAAAEANRRYRERHPEKVAETTKNAAIRYYDKNGEARRAAAREYWHKNADKLAEHNRAKANAYYHANKERILAEQRAIRGRVAAGLPKKALTRVDAGTKRSNERAADEFFSRAYTAEDVARLRSLATATNSASRDRRERFSRAHIFNDINQAARLRTALEKLLTKTRVQKTIKEVELDNRARELAGKPAIKDVQFEARRRIANLVSPTHVDPQQLLGLMRSQQWWQNTKRDDIRAVVAWAAAHAPTSSAHSDLYSALHARVELEKLLAQRGAAAVAERAQPAKPAASFVDSSEHGFTAAPTSSGPKL